MNCSAPTEQKAKAYILPRRIMLMERKIKLILILSVMLIAAALIFSEYIQPAMQEREIKRLLEEANYCAADSDCAVLDTNFGCPFGCFNLGNKNADLTGVKALWEAWQKNPSTICIYSCLESPKPEEIKCTNDKCVDTRRL